MIINSMADASSKKDSISFKFRDIAYTVSTDAGQLSGTVKYESYVDLNVSSLGKGPFKVELGYVNNSFRADPVQVGSADALVTFWMAFPYGTDFSNEPQTFVFENQS